MRNTVLAVAANVSSVFTTTCNTVARLDARDGSIVWCHYLTIDAKGRPSWSDTPPEAPPAALLAPPLLAGGRLYVGLVVPGLDQTSAYLAAFSPRRGKLMWLAKVGSAETRDFLGLGSSPLPLASWGGRVYFCPSCRRVLGVNRR